MIPFRPKEGAFWEKIDTGGGIGVESKVEKQN